jgi:AcrR family transcriptional regulator
MERRAPHQLPSGRHGLPKEYVISNQRDRILDGVMQSVAESGYAAMRIEDVIARAGVSRSTFYAHFPNKEEAFLAAYELVAGQLRAAVSAAFASAETWPARVHRGLNAFLMLLASERALAHVCIVEVLAAGPRALERRSVAMREFAGFLRPPDGDLLAPVLSPVTTETLIGGVYEVIYARVVDGRTDELPQLLPSLLYTVLLPFVGPEIAHAEYRRAEQRARPRV